MLAHGRETVSAQCLELLVNAAEIVRWQCLARTKLGERCALRIGAGRVRRVAFSTSY